MQSVAADFDGAWKYALDQYFAPFVEYFFPDAYAAIDWQVHHVFRDAELQQIAPEDRAGKKRVDKLVQVQQRDGQRAWVLIHVEVQSQRDVAFARRMFRYHARLVDRDNIPVVSLAILGDTDPRWQPTQFAQSLWGCNLSLQFPTVKLLLLDAAQLEASQNPFATLVLLHRDAQATR